jgi:hypothetical protein
MVVILAWIVGFLQIVLEKHDMDLVLCQLLVHLFLICCLSRCLIYSL